MVKRTIFRVIFSAAMLSLCPASSVASSTGWGGSSSVVVGVSLASGKASQTVAGISSASEIGSVSSVSEESSKAKGPRGVQMLKHQKFPGSVPAGNYSGITPLGGDLYAVADDKGKTEGFHVMRIRLDLESGRINDIKYEGFRSSGLPNRDEEGIAFRASDSTVYISGENDNEVLQYHLDGTPTGKRLNMNGVYGKFRPNKGLESLTYNAKTGRFWTVNEWSRPGETEGDLLLCSFGDDLQLREKIHYKTHFPLNEETKGDLMGVSELLALDNGGLLVLERRVHSNAQHTSGSVFCAIYYVSPESLKHSYVDNSMSVRLCSWRTRMNVLHQDFANYEGMCFGPRLKDGSQTLILVADSQGQYKGLLRDWFKVIVLR